MTLDTLIARSRTEKENWRYTPLEDLLKNTPPHSLAPSPFVEKRANARTARLVFVNGRYQAKLSRFGSIPSCILMGDWKTGYQLILGEQTCLVAQPIDLLFTSDEQAPPTIDINLSIEIGANGRLTLLERHMASPSITVLNTDILLHPRAKFVHGKIVAQGTHLATTKAQIAGGAYYDNFSLLRDPVLARNEIRVSLNGVEAQTALGGVMLLRDKSHADTTTCVTHQAPHCSSRQMYKTVLDGKARGVFQGKIHVAPDAQKSDGHQLSRALLLSDQAEMDAKPELEIYADDVKCSHGCSLGDLDEQAIFYLRSRGLNETQARALLVQAFVSEMLDKIHIEEWRDSFLHEIEGWLT